MATITYTINKSTLYGLVDAEVSLAADEAYADDGTSLYDSVVLTTKDKSLVEQRMDDAVEALVRKCADICKHGTGTIVFDLPDAPSANSTATTAAISRYIVLSVITSIFQSRRVSLVPQYEEKTKAALDDVISLVRTRTAPSRT